MLCHPVAVGVTKLGKKIPRQYFHPKVSISFESALQCQSRTEISRCTRENRWPAKKLVRSNWFYVKYVAYIKKLLEKDDFLRHAHSDNSMC